MALYPGDFTCPIKSLDWQANMLYTTVDSKTLLDSQRCRLDGDCNRCHMHLEIRHEETPTATNPVHQAKPHPEPRPAPAPEARDPRAGAVPFPGSITGAGQEERTMTPNPIMRYFAYTHLPKHLQNVSRHFSDLAQWIDREAPDGPEKSVALRKLLEGKDAAVRAMMDKRP